MEKFCPVCGRGYDASVAVCEDDGERLVIFSEEPSLVGRELEGKYTLTGELGAGGMGSVYLAHQATMDREVAVKVLKREFSQNKLAIKRFLREARAASKLAHPNTITVYDFGQTTDGLLYMVMEKLNGQPLADLLDAEGAISSERAVHILSQVCDSLAEAHANGITHRDLKPENIFIEPKMGNPEHVKVLDFGIAKMTQDSNTQATATGMICGTPSYMSPEQAMGKEIDGRSDIYALGILLYECLTGVQPFGGDTAMEVMLKHLNEAAPPIDPALEATIPRPLLDLMDRMLAKEAGERPASCQELKQMLVAAIGGTGSVDMPARGAIPTGRPKSTTRDAVTSFDKAGLVPGSASELDAVAKPGSRKVLIAAAAVVVLGLGGAAAFLALGGDGGADSKAPAAEVAQAPADDAPAVAEGKAGEAPAEAAEGSDEPAAADDGAGEPGEDPKAVARPAGAAADEAAEPPGAGAVAGDAMAASGDHGAELAKTAPEVERVKLTINSDPVGALVYEGEALLGPTPLTFARDKDSGVVELLLKQEGYKDAKLVLGTAMSLTQTKQLEKLVAAKKPRTKARTRRPKKRGGDSGGIGTF